MTPRTRNAGIDENGVRSCVDGIKFKAGRRIILEVGTIWSTGCGRSTQIIRRAAAIEKHKIVGRRSVRKTRRDSASSTIANKDIAHISNMILVRCMDSRPLYWCAVNFYRYRLRAVVIRRVNIVTDSNGELALNTSISRIYVNRIRPPIYGVEFKAGSIYIAQALIVTQ